MLFKCSDKLEEVIIAVIVIFSLAVKAKDQRTGNGTTSSEITNHLSTVVFKKDEVNLFLELFNQ